MSQTSTSLTLVTRSPVQNNVGSLSVPSCINNFFDSLFSRRFENDVIHIDEIMKAFWTFRDLIFDEPNNSEMYDVLFEKLNLISNKKFNLPEKKRNEFDSFIEFYYSELITDSIHGKYSYEDAYDLSEEPHYGSLQFATY
jgi:hypothetical protein